MTQRQRAGDGGTEGHDPPPFPLILRPSKDERRTNSRGSGIPLVLLISILGVQAIMHSPHSADAAAPPTPLTPPDGAHLDTFAPVLTWQPAPEAARFHLQLAPANNDGPGVDLVLAAADTSFAIPAPPAWYGLLPDMTYTWRLRASSTPDGEATADWGPWSLPHTFRTPVVTPTTITLQPVAAPADTPTLTWADNNANVWLYEVQVSASPAFDATAPLLWETRHGGATTPPRSYTIPASAALRPGTSYHWRVRPRIQGDGTPLAWTPAASFRTPDGWRPAPGVSWQIQLQGGIDMSVQAAFWDLDLFDTPQAVIDALHASGAHVACYLNAGTWEDWRPDAARFPAVLLGKSNGWPGERWLDIRRLDLLAPLIEARLDLCRVRGFDGVDFDNMDGFANDTGFPLTAADQLAYNTYLAQAAHARGLAAGLKNDLEQAAALQPHFDWLLVEQCFEQGLCHLTAPFAAAGKAILAIEYDPPLHAFCEQARRSGISAIRKRPALDAWREVCP